MDIVEINVRVNYYGIVYLIVLLIKLVYRLMSAPFLSINLVYFT